MYTAFVIQRNHLLAFSHGERVRYAILFVPLKAAWGIIMTINLIFRIAAVGILVSVLGQVLKHSGREEQAFLVSLAGLILVLLWVVPYILELFETVQTLFAL